MVKISGVESKNLYQPKTEVKALPIRNIERNIELGFANSRRNDVQSGLAKFHLQLAASHSVAQARVQQSTPVGQVDMDRVEFVFDRTVNADDLAYQISDKNTFLNEAEKAELLAMAVRSDRAAQLLTSNQASDVPNRAYDAQREIATALGQGYAQGTISDADLRGLAETLGNDDFDNTASQRFVTVLAQDPNNLHGGGIVEAYGRTADALGQEAAAALAFSSSEELIRGNLTTPESRQAAFDQVRSFLDSEPMSYVPEFRYGSSPSLESAYVQSLTNAARLNCWPGSSNDQELDAMLEKAGPRYVQEAIARSSHIEGDDASSSALNEFGDASRRLAQDNDGDDRHDWNINVALAYTQSEALINGNLTTPEERINAFDILNHELADSRDASSEAAQEGYTLLRAPAMAEGLAQLLESHSDEILTAKIGADGKNYEGLADLTNLFQSTLFSPYTSEVTRNRIEAAIGTYIDTAFTGADNDSQVIGNRLGSLLGVLDAASQNAINAAKKPEEVSFIDQVSKDLAKTVLSAGAKALLKGTGPIGVLAGGFVLDQILNKIFKNKPPSPEQLGEAYVDLLESNGQNISLGESLRNQYTNLLTQTITAMNQLRDDATGQEFRDLTDASLQAGQLLDGIRDGYGEIIDSYQLDNGQINRALDNWSDNYEEPETI